MQSIVSFAGTGTGTGSPAIVNQFQILIVARALQAQINAGTYLVCVR